MKSPKVKGIGEVVTEYGAKVMKIFKKGLLQRSLFDFYGDVKANAIRVKESSSVPQTPVDKDGGVVYVKNSDGKLYYKSNEVSEIELSASDANTQNTTTLSFVDSSNDILLRNTTGGAGSGTDDIKFVAGSNVTLTHTDADNITIASTDTNTTYSIQDGELSKNNFTDADHTKLDGIEASADVTDAANVTDAGALMDSELTDLAGVKGVTISTLQVKPSEGAFANGDKTKLDSIAANATADQTNVTGSSGSCTGNAATATALTAGDKTIDGSLTIGANQAGHDFSLHGATTNFSKMQWDSSANFLKFSDQAKVVFGSGVAAADFDSSIQANGSNLVIYNDTGSIQIGDTVEITGDLDVTGNIDLPGIVRPGLTYIKILPRDFIPDDVGRPVQTNDSTSNRFLVSHSTAKMYASVEIPLGFKATAVDVYGSGTSNMTVYVANINSSSPTSLGNGSIGTTFTISSAVNADATNYLLIELSQTSLEKVYGGKVTIAKI